MENDLTRILLVVEDIKKSLTDIQIDICKICREKEVKKANKPILIKSTITVEDYD